MKMTQYHEFYTLAYIAKNRLRIKPKDEEEAKQVVKEQAVKEQAVKEQVKTNTIKEENEMLDLVKLYKERKIEKISEDAETARVKAWEKDTTYKTLKDLSEKTKTKSDYLFAFWFKAAPDLVEKELDKILKDKEEKELQLDKFISEVDAYLSLCETYEQKINALINFGILDNSGRLNV